LANNEEKESDLQPGRRKKKKGALSVKNYRPPKNRGGGRGSEKDYGEKPARKKIKEGGASSGGPALIFTGQVGARRITNKARQRKPLFGSQGSLKGEGDAEGETLDKEKWTAQAQKSPLGRGGRSDPKRGEQRRR